MRPYAFLLLIAGATLLFRLGDLPFTGADEPRYARIAEEMHLEGRWVTPVLQGLPWLEKPPLYYWITIPLYSVFGISETTARMGPALCALLAACAVCWAGRRSKGPVAGFMAGVVTLTTLGISVFGRGASTDMPFTAFYTVALSILYVSLPEKQPSRVLLASGYVSLGAAILAKGPVALVLMLGTVLLFWVLDEKKTGIRKLHVATGALAAAAVALPWFVLAFLQNGFAFITVHLVNHNLARFVSDIHHHAQPFYYYLPVLLGLFFPWSAWLYTLVCRPVAGLRRWRQWEPQSMFAAFWVLFPVLFFSMSSSKLPGYVLVSLPPLALLLGGSFARLLEKGEPDGHVVAAWLHGALSAGLAVAVPVMVHTAYGEPWPVALPLAAAAAVPALFIIWTACRRRWTRMIAATAAQGVIVVLTLTYIGFPLIAAHHSTRDIARQGLAARQGTEPIVTHRFFHHTLFYYTGYGVQAESRKPGDLADLAMKYPQMLVVTERQYLGEIRGMHGLTVDEVGRQGKLTLLRLRHR